jgi:hypothetical protein
MAVDIKAKTSAFTKPLLFQKPFVKESGCFIGQLPKKSPGRLTKGLA